MKPYDEIEKLYDIDYEANTSSLYEYNEAKRYYHGEQLPFDVQAALAERGQVEVVENVYKMIVDKILGYKSESIQEVKVSGRQEQDKPLATLLNDLLKVFSQQDGFDAEVVKRDKDLILGMAVMQIWVKKDKDGDYHISLENIPADTFIVDKYAKEQNASDARRYHRIININLDEAKRQFNTEITPTTQEQYDDRVAVVESWFKEKIIDERGRERVGFSRYVWNRTNGILAYEPVPFKTGEHPFIVTRYQIDHRLKWYGLFRNIKPMQDYINLAENRMLNMMSSMKIFYEEGAVQDADEFVLRASLDNAIVKVNDGALTQKKIEFIQHNAQITALSQKVQEKLNLTKILSGLNDEALGFGGNRQSGVAMQQRQEVGLMGLGEYLKISDEMDKAVFKKALNFIMHYFTKKQIFKIVDKEVGERYIAINDPENKDTHIRVGKFDLIYKTQLKQFGREERFTHWSEILKSLAQIRPDIAPAMLPAMLKDTESPVVDDIKEILAKSDEQAAKNSEQQAQIQQKQLELELAKLEVEILETRAKAEKYKAQAELANSITAANKQQNTSDDLVDIFTDTNKQLKQAKTNTSASADKTRTGRIKGMDFR
jgi:hypothetical protein